VAENILAALAGLIAAFIAASFVEWFVHVLMHRRILLGQVHYDHHARGDGDGWFWEFIYYTGAAIPGSIIFLASAYFWTGWWWLAGGLAAGSWLYAMFAAYAHQIQHERPELVFWMHPPVHTIHHKHEMYRRNYGIGVDWWDKLFRTYERKDWQPDPTRTRTRLRDFFAIKWF
jgi:sterol desaturase/sphingolipid hydroxylase (fatty acid hydroxylase superfamily)